MEAETEGNPIPIAEWRTLSFANSKIILGIIPLSRTTSHVLRSYAESDARVFEIGCISLSASWPEGRPAEAALCLPVVRRCTAVATMPVFFPRSSPGRIGDAALLRCNSDNGAASNAVICL